jgi:hypothetical protein
MLGIENWLSTGALPLPKKSGDSQTGDSSASEPFVSRKRKPRHTIRRCHRASRFSSGLGATDGNLGQCRRGNSSSEKFTCLEFCPRMSMREGAVRWTSHADESLVLFLSWNVLDVPGRGLGRPNACRLEPGHFLRQRLHCPKWPVDLRTYRQRRQTKIANTMRQSNDKEMVDTEPQGK